MSDLARYVVQVDPNDVRGPGESLQDWSRHTCWRKLISERGEPVDTSERAYWAAYRWQHGNRTRPGRACQECRFLP